MWWLQVIAWPLPPSLYLAVLHSVTEESVQQQVLQLGVPVESLFDFTQKDTGRGKTVLMFSRHTVIKTPFKQSSMPFENFIPINWLVTVHCKLWVLNVRLRNNCARLHKVNQCHNHNFLILVSQYDFMGRVLLFLSFLTSTLQHNALTKRQFYNLMALQKVFLALKETAA